jgi:AraC-like DNA-binding protein
MILEKEYPKSFFSSEEGIEECVTEMNLPIGKGYYKEIYFEGVHIGYGNVVLSDKVLLAFESDFETVEMHFALKGTSRAASDTFDGVVRFDTHQHNIMYANGVCGEMHWESEELRLCEINMSPAFFKKFLPEDRAIFDKFRTMMERRKSAMLRSDHYRISHLMYRIIDEIIHCERKGLFKRMFLEAKVIELLLLQLEQLTEEHAPNTSLKKADIDKIYAVREFMLHNLGSVCSLIDLAHQVGTNEFTLKKGFKELFGTTVFGFWNDAKMEQAKLLLLEQNMTVNEVSDTIGYKNPRHFSTAFKKKYGVLPSLVKK